MPDIIELTKQLVTCPSITPDDAGCQTILGDHLQKLGFTIEQHPFGKVKNIWARYGTGQPLFVFIGHTDVVPTGPVEQWSSPPFQPEIRNGLLYGRGAADMKGSLAAMMDACEKFLAEHPKPKGSIAWLITSDEEGVSIDGTAKVVEVLQKRQEKVNWCLVGEPTCDKEFGDIAKIGRRGSLSGKIIIHGKQGHIAYPHLADNPVHRALPALSELVSTVWDKGNEFFQPTSLQISNIHAGTGAGNVIPGDLEVRFNLRYSPVITGKQIQETIDAIFYRHNLRYSLEWDHSGKPFLTSRGELVEACVKSIQDVTGLKPELSTTGGTSDGRFMAATGCQIVEFGPRNRSIHQIDEHVAVDDLIALGEVYRQILVRLLG